MKLMGHSSIDTTMQFYINVSDDRDDLVRSTMAIRVTEMSRKPKTALSGAA